MGKQKPQESADSEGIQDINEESIKEDHTNKSVKYITFIDQIENNKLKIENQQQLTSGNKMRFKAI
jgi:hypothetical protein